MVMSVVSIHDFAPVDTRLRSVSHTFVTQELQAGRQYSSVIIISRKKKNGNASPPETAICYTVLRVKCHTKPI